MKLYLLTWPETDYDMYDSCVVSAKSSKAALKICPSSYYIWSSKENGWLVKRCEDAGIHERTDWANDLAEIKVTCLGIYTKNKSEVICSSFNAS